MALTTAVVLGLVLGSAAVAAGPAYAAAAPAPDRLHLVTFEAAGTAGYRGELPLPVRRTALTRQQDAALAQVGAPVPTYRWTTALSGVAVGLTPEQAERLRRLPGVAGVERNAVRSLAGVRSVAAAPARAVPGHGGAGVVIGVVDSGVWPEDPLFADAPRLGRLPRGFDGDCQPGEEWEAETCSGKLVAAAWFVAGFGADRVAEAESLSARDGHGHGTQVASLAAGNSGVSTGPAGLPERYSGVAPRARLAVYKACWSAPDPRDDGCATADLVTAVDLAVADGVDVLNLSVTGSPGIGAVERALLGAAEAGVVVVAAAGNGGAVPASPAQPWVTSVGGLAADAATGAVVLPGGRRLEGAMPAGRGVRAPVVLAGDVPAEGWTRHEAARCLPDSLDASMTAGAVVVCERGGIARLEKSLAVERADGAGMVLVNVAPGRVAHDVHAVPSVHLNRVAGAELVRWLRAHRRAEVSLQSLRGRGSPDKVAPWSAAGAPTGRFVKPDLVARASGVLAASPPASFGGRWAFLDGTSAAAARTAGAAAVVLARHDWPAAVVRSVLATSAAPVAGPTLRSGAGRLRLRAALRTRLVHEVPLTDYRGWLRGDLADVNTPSVLLRGGDRSARRTITNLDDHARYWSVADSGFAHHSVTVTPAAVRLSPGESATYTVTVVGSRAGVVDDGTVTWRGPRGVQVRVPVVIGR